DRFHFRGRRSRPVRICRTARAAGGRAGVLKRIPDVTRCKRCKRSTPAHRWRYTSTEPRVLPERRLKMNRPIAILLGVALLLSADAVFARGGRGSGGHAGGGGFHGGATSMGFHGGGTSMGFHGGHGGIATVGARFAHP